MTTDYEERLRRVEAELAELKSAVQELKFKNGAIVVNPSATWGKLLKYTDRAIRDKT